MNKQTSLKALLIIICCTATQIQATLTTLQFWDPSPIYSALNHKPANNHCLELHTYNEFNDPEKKVPLMTLSVTPVIQRSIRAQDDKGTQFGVMTTDADPSHGNHLGDFRGLPFALGLYLGADENGKYLTGDKAVNNADAITDSTGTNTIGQTKLPQAIKDTLMDSNSAKLPFASILYDTRTLTDASSPGSRSAYLTTLFSDETLYRVTSTYQDTSPEYFGCFSVPSEYMKAGLRFEFDINLSKYIDLVIQGGCVNVQQKLLSPLKSLTAAFTFTNDSGTSVNATSAIYDAMWVYSAATTPAGIMATQQQAAKDAFNDQITKNIDALLSADGGIGFEYKDYNVFQAEDVRFCLSFKYPVTKNTSTLAEEDEYAPLIFTPYLQIAGSVPVGNSLKYLNALEISAGNNGHFSLGGTAGLSCDFIETIQIGIEAGYDYFFDAVHENRPCPNSQYQSVLYPYKRDINVQPGANTHCAVTISAYQFMQNANFFASYEYIQHGQDKHTLVTENANFFAEFLDQDTRWNSQMFNAGLNFDISPDFNFGIVCQLPVSQRNAFNTASAGASLSFLF